MTPPCDGERHFHDVGRMADLPVNSGMPAYCHCQSAAVRVSHLGDGWEVTLLDGTPVLETKDALVLVADSELIVGIVRPLSEA